ncbi:hypothetical protein LCGC14_2142030, partial [marine sediment metagenome]
MNMIELKIMFDTIVILFFCSPCVDRKCLARSLVIHIYTIPPNTCPKWVFIRECFLPFFV